MKRKMLINENEASDLESESLPSTPTSNDFYAFFKEEIEEGQATSEKVPVRDDSALGMPNASPLQTYEAPSIKRFRTTPPPDSMLKKIKIVEDEDSFKIQSTTEIKNGSYWGLNSKANTLQNNYPHLYEICRLFERPGKIFDPSPTPADSQNKLKKEK